jgi:hypothetical protein
MGIRASIPVTTGVVRPVELFVAVLGASNYTYVEATDTQRSADFIQSHSHAVEYVGGVPAAIVPDQLRTGIRDPCRYEPILQRTYEEWAAHYSTAIVPRDRRSLVIKLMFHIAPHLGCATVNTGCVARRPPWPLRIACPSSGS